MSSYPNSDTPCIHPDAAQNVLLWGRVHTECGGLVTPSERLRELTVNEARTLSESGQVPAWAVAALAYDRKERLEQPAKPPPAAPDIATPLGIGTGLTTSPARSGAAALFTTWRKPPVRWNPCAFLSRSTRRGVTNDGEVFRVRSNHVAAILDGSPHVAVVYLIGPGPAYCANWREWAAEPTPGWEAGDHHFGRTPLLRFTHIETGRKVALISSGSWFGESEPSPDLAAAAMIELDRELFSKLKTHVLATPYATGSVALLTTIPYGEQWPVVSPELQQLIRETTGQGRIEMFEPLVDEVQNVVELDGRLMYAHCAQRLFTGAGTWSEAPASDDDFGKRDGDLSYLPGRYRVTFTPPANWNHVGLLGVWDDETGSWHYPTSGTHTTWADGSELLLAATNKVGRWRFTIHESITFDNLGRGPLDKWVQALLKIEDALRVGSEPQQLAARLVRQLIVTTIGGLAARGHDVNRSAPLDAIGGIPTHLHPEVIGDRVHWIEPSPVLFPERAHPEWAAHIWARCRARMATFALQYPRESLLGIGLDALWLDTPDVGQFATEAKVGGLRAKAWAIGPFRAPTSLAELKALRQKGDLTDGQE